MTRFVLGDFSVYRAVHEPGTSYQKQIMQLNTGEFLEVCHPHCVCENWEGYAVKHNSVN